MGNGQGLGLALALIDGGGLAGRFLLRLGLCGILLPRAGGQEGTAGTGCAAYQRAGQQQGDGLLRAAALVLVIDSMRKKKSNSIPQALGTNYFREER